MAEQDAIKKAEVEKEKHLAELKRIEEEKKEQKRLIEEEAIKKAEMEKKSVLRS